MLNNLFDKTKPINLIIFFLLFIIYYTNVFISTQSEPISLLYIVLEIFRFFVYVLFILILNFIIHKNNLTDKNYYAILVFISLFSLSTAGILSFKELLSSFFVLFFFRKIFNTYKVSDYKKLFFDLGLLLGIITMINPLFSLLFILIVIAFIIFAVNNIKTLLLSVMGFLSPIILSYTYLLVTDNIKLFHKIFDINLSISLDFHFSDNIYYILLIITSIGLILSMYIMSKKQYINNSHKNQWIIILASYIFSLLFVCIDQVDKELVISILFIPLAIIISNYIEIIKIKWLKEVILAIFILLPFIN